MSYEKVFRRVVLCGDCEYFKVEHFFGNDFHLCQLIRDKDDSPIMVDPIEDYCSKGVLKHE